MDQLGLVGGTFDPPHVGHMLVGSHARRALGLSRVLYVVAPAPWQKADRIISAPEERLALVELACAAHDGLEASDIEIRRPGNTYTIDTVEALEQSGVERPWLILGSDAAAGLDTWHRHEELRSKVRLAVVDRPGGGDLPAEWDFTRIEVPALDVSSSDLRERRRSGRCVEVLIPGPVIDEMDRRGLHPELVDPAEPDATPGVFVDAGGSDGR